MRRKTRDLSDLNAYHLISERYLPYNSDRVEIKLKITKYVPFSYIGFGILTEERLNKKTSGLDK